MHTLQLIGERLISAPCQLFLALNAYDALLT